MTAMRRTMAAAALAALLALGNPGAAAAATSGFNDEYVYATTRSVSAMDVNPALKVTLIPATVVIDTVFLPFALIAGLVT